MIARCTNENYKGYKNYGGRGIQVKFASFDEFYACVGNRPSGDHSLDRFPDQNGHYEPGNVRWATLIEQGRNKRNNRRIVYQDQEMTLAEASERFGIGFTTLDERLKADWDVEKALKTPVRKKRR